MKRRRILPLIGSMIAMCILGCSSLTSNSVAAPDTTLLISAAASLKESLLEIKPLFEQRHKNVSINHNFGASGALEQQIENGAPADVFVSAGKKQMDALQQKDLIITNSNRNLLTNTLVLIVPKNSNSNITNFQQLANSNVKKIAVGEPKSVPVGQYTEEVFQNLKISQQVQPKLVLGNNVRNVLSVVESGNVDAGIVYSTDAQVSNQVKIAAVAPENLHSPIVYPIAVLKNSKNSQAALDYEQFLASDAARNIFKKHGFAIAK